MCWTKANGYNPVVDVNAYRETLTSLFIDCPQIHEKINKLSYEQDKIIEVVEQYLNCKNLSTPNIGTSQEEKANKTETKNKLQISVLAGGGTMSYIVRTYFDRILNESFAPSAAIGISLNHQIARNFGKWNIGLDILYRNYQRSYNEYAGVTYPPSSRGRASLLFLSPHVNFKLLPRKNTTPFFKVGSMGIAVLLTSYFQPANIFIGGRVQHKKLNVEVRYENIGIFDAYSNGHSFILLASYRIIN